MCLIVRERESEGCFIIFQQQQQQQREKNEMFL